MLVLLSALTLIAIVVNAVGAWGVSRRRLAIGLFFLATASVLTVALVAYWFGHQSAFTLLVGGAIMSVAASVLNAAIVIGEFVWWRHVLRAALFALLVLLAGLV